MLVTPRTPTAVRKYPSLSIGGYALDEADVYDDGEGACGFDDDRREFAELVARLQEGDVDAVIVPNLSRLSRDRRTRLRLLVNLDDAGVELHSVERGHIDLEAAYALAIETMKPRPTTAGSERRLSVQSGRPVGG